MTSQEQINETISFGPDGLAPVVIQDAASDAVLMLAYMNAEALALTRSTGRVHFWSRSRGKLWRKGETSGHEQIVDEVFVNCESNSLLITVTQIGAVCHTGYPTCFYRRLETDDSLTVVRDRWFDPADVYASSAKPFPARTRLWYGAYEYLRDNDLGTVSGTSKRLRDPETRLAGRVSDELRELAGVLAGEHVHTDRESDALLEGTQSLYWLALVAVRDGITWDRLRPDRALVTTTESLAPETAARMLETEAIAWATSGAASADSTARIHAAMAIVAQACFSVGVTPETVIERDLNELRARAYLAPHFGEPEAG